MSSPTAINVSNLQQQAQYNLQWWDWLVQVTRGALNPQKCCCLAYNWQLDAKGILQLTPPALTPITLSNPDDPTQQMIPLNKCHEGT